MQAVELVLVLRLLGADALGTFQQGVQPCDSAQDIGACRAQFPLDLADHDAEDGPLPFDDTAQALELFGVGVAAGFTPEFCKR